MKSKDLDYLKMVSVVDEILKKYNTVWAGNEATAEEVVTIRSIHADLDTTQQNATTTSTGLTKEKNEVEDQMIDLALKLSGFAGSYAKKKKDNDLEAKMKLKKTRLDDMRDEELEQRMWVLHKDLTAIGAPLTVYGGTPERLTAFAALIQRFTSLKPAAQVVIKTRKGHNSTVPQLMAELKEAFKILDGIVPQWDDTNPDFVRDYKNAREVRDSGDGGDKPADAKKPDA